MPLSVAVISLPPVILKVKSSPSISLPVRLVEPLPSSSNDTSETDANVGASFTADTLRLTFALDDSLPSDTLNVKLSSPL